ncbi:MAG: hypothetical protein AAGG44_20130 [Planctomycetota bacterium]
MQVSNGTTGKTTLNGELKAMERSPAESWGRLVYIVLLAGVVLLGLATRRFPGFFPNWIAEYTGDTLWALALFIFLRIVFPGARILPLGRRTPCFFRGRV